MVGDGCPLFYYIIRMITKEKIIQILLDEKIEQDFFIVDVLIQSNNDIKIYIDNKQGISIRTCVLVSRHVEGILLSEDLDFSLEVSSPGLNLPLRVPQQFEKTLGKIVEVVDIEGNKVEGTLLKYDSEGIILEQEKIIKKEGKKKKETVVEEVAFLFNKIKSTKILVSIK